MKITSVDTCVTVISEELAELHNRGEPDTTGPEAHLQRERGEKKCLEKIDE